MAAHRQIIPCPLPCYWSFALLRSINVYHSVVLILISYSRGLMPLSSNVAAPAPALLRLNKGLSLSLAPTIAILHQMPKNELTGDVCSQNLMKASLCVSNKYHTFGKIMLHRKYILNIHSPRPCRALVFIFDNHVLEQTFFSGEGRSGEVTPTFELFF